MPIFLTIIHYWHIRLLGAISGFAYGVVAFKTVETVDEMGGCTLNTGINPGVIPILIICAA